MLLHTWVGPNPGLRRRPLSSSASLFTYLLCLETVIHSLWVIMGRMSSPSASWPLSLSLSHWTYLLWWFVCSYIIQRASRWEVMITWHSHFMFSPFCPVELFLLTIDNRKQFSSGWKWELGTSLSSTTCFVLARDKVQFMPRGICYLMEETTKPLSDFSKVASVRIKTVIKREHKC